MGSRGLIRVVGLGPGVEELLTPLARMALEAAQDLVGYREYLRRAEALVSCEGKSLYPFPMGGELERCRKALELAER
ncbi:MAG TPA: cobalt-precorrin-8X methylmutase, partial [Thermosulfidibacter takaii]|nr:cobalt-precorrin-8X methylmutase [Thermosulfidibacter takaii]